jgi:hypothetical protein
LSDAEIVRIEREVEAARARLLTDLSRLRSPRAYDDFTETAKSVLVNKAKTSALSAWQDLLENMKAKAAENPAATLAIGAGLAWRLLHHPPIATALIGAGLFSLLRTTPANLREGGDYVSHATERLKQQATDLAGGVADRASTLSSGLMNNAGTITEAIKEQSTQLASAATDKVQEWAAGVGDAPREVPHHVASLARTTEGSPEVRDTILLGVASAAVVGALGVAYQRRNR